MNNFYKKTSHHLKIIGGGVATTALGILIFIILELMTLFAKTTDISVSNYLSHSITTFNILFFFAIAPVVFLHYLFMYILEKDAKEKVTAKNAGFVGMNLGLALVFLGSFAAFLLIGHRITWEVLLRMLLNGLVSALLIGYVAGHYCYRLMKNN